jgi:hypothetical protein
MLSSLGVSLDNMAKRSKSSLLDQVAAEESAAPSLFLVSTEEEGNQEMERRGEFTAERLMESRPTIYKALVDGLGQGLGVRQLCRAYRVSHHTVAAVMARESQAVATLKERTVSVLRTFGRLAADRLLDEVDQIPIQSLPIALGIAVEKAELLSGGATSRIEHSDSGPTHEDYLRMISGKVIEAEVVPVIGLEGGEVAQKEADPGAAVQAGGAAVQAGPFEVAAPGAGLALLPGVSSAALVPTGNHWNHAKPDEQSDGLTGSDSVEAGIATHSATHSASFEAVEDGQPATQEGTQRVEDAGMIIEAAASIERRERAPGPRTEGGRGSAKSRRVSGGH